MTVSVTATFAPLPCHLSVHGTSRMATWMGKGGEAQPFASSLAHPGPRQSTKAPSTKAKHQNAGGTALPGPALGWLPWPGLCDLAHPQPQTLLGRPGAGDTRQPDQLNAASILAARCGWGVCGPWLLVVTVVCVCVVLWCAVCVLCICWSLPLPAGRGHTNEISPHLLPAEPASPPAAPSPPPPPSSQLRDPAWAPSQAGRETPTHPHPYPRTCTGHAHARAQARQVNTCRPTGGVQLSRRAGRKHQGVGCPPRRASRQDRGGNGKGTVSHSNRDTSRAPKLHAAGLA